MRVLFFKTGTPDNEGYVGSFLCLGHDTTVIQYDVGGFNIAEVMRQHRPDMAVYIGAPPSCHHNPVPSSQALAEANHVAPMVLICPDSGDAPWWPALEEYHNAESFRLQISIDGCKDLPITKWGRADITPHDPALFPHVPYNERQYQVGFSGQIGARSAMLQALQAKGLLTFHQGSPHRPYSAMCDFYSHCKCITNHARTGTWQRWHVKGRVVEAGLAGAVLLESAESPSKEWFEEGVDYLSWHNLEELVDLAQRNGPDMEAMAARFHQKILERHSARPFWERIFKELGL